MSSEIFDSPMFKRGKRRKASRGGVISNLDQTLSVEERRVADRDAKNLDIFTDSVDSAPDYKHGGMLGPGSDGSIKLSISDFQRQDTKAYKQGERRNIIPIALVPSNAYEKGFDYLLTDADYEAVRAGYVCDNCLCWQAIPGAAKCLTSDGTGCGYLRPIEGLSSALGTG